MFLDYVLSMLLKKVEFLGNCPVSLCIMGVCLLRSLGGNFVDVAARIREILESAGMSQESLPSNVVSSAQVLANVANLLNIRDTELSR